MVKRLRSEDGAEVVEFALVFPVFAFIVFGLIYGLFAVAAHVSLAHATSRGVRYASIPVDPLGGTYRSTGEIEAYMDGQSPFFSASTCETTVVGEERTNAPVSLDVACDFPNPAGRVVSALSGLIDRDRPVSHSDALVISAQAEARRE